MRKIVTLFFLLCVSLVAEDCFKMSGQVFCDNDVIKITKTGQSMLVKVNNIGGGRVSWDLYIFFFNPTLEKGLRGEAYPNTSDFFDYQFKLGNVTKIYSNTQTGRNKILKEFERQKGNKEKQIKQTAQKCHKGAIKNSNNSQELQELLEIFCAYSIKQKFQPPKVSLLDSTYEMVFPKGDERKSLDYFLNPTWK